MFRTALLILSGNASTSLLLLARNLVIARLIPVEDYGIAATFAVVMALVEMASTLGLQQQIIQANDGDNPHFQAALQGFQFMRGVASGILLFLLAAPIARFLNIPEAIWAYQALALVPILKALEHFDIYRLNREMQFYPLLLTGGIPALASLVVVWPLVIWLEDWRVMLFSILIQITFRTITSHIFSERPYKMVFDVKIVKRSLRFGWPILTNSALMFFIFQGDKLIVGRVLGMETLAIFAMGMTLTLTPTLVIAKSAQNFFLPQLSKLNRDEPNEEKQFQHFAMVTSEVHILFAVGFTCLIAFLGPSITYILLGNKFSNLIPIFTLLAALQGFRLLKGGASSVALADGKTENALAANIFRVALLPVGYWIAIYTNDITYIIYTSIVGELGGFAVALLLLSHRSKVSITPLYKPIYAALTLFLLLIQRESIQMLSWSGLGILLVFLLMYNFMKDLRYYALNRRS